MGVFYNNIFMGSSTEPLISSDNFFEAKTKKNTTVHISKKYLNRYSVSCTKPQFDILNNFSIDDDQPNFYLNCFILGYDITCI